ncbi:hypothetical protein [Christiangramia sp. SM2212]|uniref:Uncharacterized protein n=1 Tax=Christiangramia sediminicola TaxID=3073267 RepID=A0ABU1ENQ4_9FLAO|nr:hypothetical protein [Christiangramia sp. SM2212]MDR5590015.1 hypothetical protein [Christiangramia sp. SM2212]
MKKFLFILLGLILLSLVWFLFIKEYDYRFHFQADYSPAVVKRELQDLGTYEIFNATPKISNLHSDQFSELKQEIDFRNNRLDLSWELEQEEDSLTDIYLHIAGPDKIKNRLSILNPFAESNYIDSLKTSFSKLGKGLIEKQKLYRIHIEDTISFSPSLDCVCKPAENIKIENKASQMVRDIQYLEDFVMIHELKLTGFPFLKIKRWDRENDVIDFDFCFPINLAQDIRPNSFVEFQQFPSSTSLKAIYNGNYRISDIAWYELIYEAKKRNLRTTELPIEIFQDNPKEGVDALSWKAEIYLPISE